MTCGKNRHPSPASRLQMHANHKLRRPPVRFPPTSVQAASESKPQGEAAEGRQLHTPMYDYSSNDANCHTCGQ